MRSKKVQEVLRRPKKVQNWSIKFQNTLNDRVYKTNCSKSPNLHIYTEYWCWKKLLHFSIIIYQFLMLVLLQIHLNSFSFYFCVLPNLPRNLLLFQFTRSELKKQTVVKEEVKVNFLNKGQFPWWCFSGLVKSIRWSSPPQK